MYKFLLNSSCRTPNVCMVWISSGKVKESLLANLKNTHIKSASSSRELLRLLDKNLRANQINVVDADSATALLTDTK